MVVLYMSAKDKVDDSYNKDVVIIANKDGMMWTMDKDGELPDGWFRITLADVVEGGNERMSKLTEIKERYTEEALQTLCTGCLHNVYKHYDDYKINTLGKFIELYVDLFPHPVTNGSSLDWDDWCRSVNLSYIETRRVTVVDRENMARKEFFGDVF
jgi:hypothetical protein